MNKKVWKSGIIIIALLITYFSMDILRALSFPFDALPENVYLRSFLIRLIDYSALLITGILLFRKHLPQIMGLHHSPGRSFLFAFSCVLPMMLVFWFVFVINDQISFEAVYNQAILPAVFEEVAYRALVLGVLYRICQWKFLPAILLNGIVFGLAHLYQANDLTAALLTFAITFIGAVWFGWLYVKWGFNLYIPIFLHLLMNLSWVLFEVSPGAAGNWIANVARLITILASVVITFHYTRQTRTLSWRNFNVTRSV